MATTDGVACRQWVVRGRVQGVGFRHFVVRSATRLGLAGCVRNLPDGDVEVVATGREQELAQLEADIRRGPSAARVTGVRTGPGALPPGCAGFEVLG